MPIESSELANTPLRIASARIESPSLATRPSRARARLRLLEMKQDIHPKYYPECKVTFRGEVVMTVGATVPSLNVEVWSGSHPFFTGQKSFVDTLGRVERFQKKFAGKYFDNAKKK